MEKFENATGIKGSYAISAITVAVLVFLFLSFGAVFLFDVFLILYPAYASFRQMQMDEVTGFHWLKYWIIFSLFQAVEYFLWWIPGFRWAKFIFLIWCFLPIPYNGSAVVYNNYIHPFFEKNSETVERILNMVKAWKNLAEERVTRTITERFSTNLEE
ncbi:receptor expression-enhancing protein 5 isoform X2 [Parasteatoda tepidariorum]|nr:receptor expression-enhancing protein 6 isoform X2 [Parasteatoda tepidariorum]